ncbi:tail fiber domain-containing protein [candidate division KSB1 bacterium]|nr:MAG: tail fiber domain-containing protein [candidate division KSB1 bacterium]MCE7941597.1 tail fiber domain-containing protein [Chlorobi bacterium CHB1]MDL1875513.1 tail fiber domain-containing protein [Cytophagia bacterium CHB2]
MAEFEKLLKTVFYYPDANSIAMATKGKERLRIDGDGHFGFGTRQNNQETVRIQGETSDASKLALLINNAAQNSLLAVRNDGNVGIGTATPAARLHVPAGAILNGIAIGIDPPGDIGFPFPYETVGTRHTAYNLRLHSGNVIHFHTGNSQAPVASIDLFGVYQTSSLVNKERINDLSSQEAVEILTNLRPVKFVFKGDRQQRCHVGFIAEEVPAVAASADRTMISLMDIVGVLTSVVKEQQTTILALAEQVHVLEAGYKDLAESAKSRQAKALKKTASVGKASAKAMPGQPARRRPKRSATSPKDLPTRRRKP